MNLDQALQSQNFVTSTQGIQPPPPADASTTSQSGGEPTGQTLPAGGVLVEPEQGLPAEDPGIRSNPSSTVEDKKSSPSKKRSEPDTAKSSSTNNDDPGGSRGSLPFVFYITLAVILAFIAFLFKKFREFLRRLKTEPKPPEKKEEVVCKTCGGSGKVKKKRTISAPCGHCKQTGRDICHHCGGSGHYGGGLTVPQTQDEVDSLMKCDYCKGKGFSNPSVACCMCKGARKEYAEESYEAACPDCRGVSR